MNENARSEIRGNSSDEGGVASGAPDQVQPSDAQSANEGEGAQQLYDTAPAPAKPSRYSLGGSSPRRNRRGRNSPPETQTPERRAELTRQAAARLARSKKTTIPVRVKASLELHEALVAIAEKLGGAFSVPDVALRCTELGAEKWARELRLHVEAVADPLRVFETVPAAADRKSYGIDEQRVRDELAAEAAERAADHDAAARNLHLPGRRRATA